MNWHRVWAMVIRYFINFRHSYDRLGDMFYWPAMDLLLWGLTGLYLAQFSTRPLSVISVILTGVVLWIVIWRAQYEITTNLLAELWDQNILNIFVSPLTAAEWVTSFIIVGLIKMTISLIFSATLAYYLYHFSLLNYGLYLVPVMLSLLLTGWTVGFFISAFLIRFGTRVQTIAWMGVVLLAPFSALYYPLSVLPTWAQKAALVVPPSYMFEGLRQVLATGHMSPDKLLWSFGLNILYLSLALWFFIFMFKKTRKAGFGKLV